MGFFDTFYDAGGQEGQVKLYDNRLRTFRIGDKVPPLRMEEAFSTKLYQGSTYSIAMREGGFVNIKEQVFVSWSKDYAHYVPVFDIYGGDFSLWDESKETYFFMIRVPLFL